MIQRNQELFGRTLSRAFDNYNASRLAACNRPREKIIKDRDNCIQLGFSEKVCAMAHVVREASPNCTLPRAVALSLDADVEKARDRCLALQLLFLRASESMGNHDSKVVDADSVD